MATIRVNVPPEHTPQEEAQLVADVAAAYVESTGSDDVVVEVERPEEVDYRAVRTSGSSRWAN